MKKITYLILIAICLSGLTLKAQEKESIDEKISSLSGVAEGLNERLTTAEGSLSKLSKIKVSGYIQVQYQNFENPSIQPTNYFSIRRARVKFTYEMTDGVKFVLQPDFVPGSLSVKDAYVVLNDRWTKAFSLTAGKFNRPNYEVEYSSSQRELPERSAVIRAIYPGERAIGAKLEFNPINIPVHFQLAFLNGADGISIIDNAKVNLNSVENKDFDNYKDIMARVTYNLTLGNLGGLDFGVNGYYGSLKSMATSTLSSDFKTVMDVKVGDPIKRNWIGAEFQLYADILGGMSIKGEYLTGMNAQVGYKPYNLVEDNKPKAGETVIYTNNAKSGLPNFQNNFSGYYIYFIKNLGKKNQFAFRYDYYDPNTDVKGKNLTEKTMVDGYSNTDKTLVKKMSTSDLATTTYGFALHHYFDDNIRITLAYDIVQNEKVGSVGLITGDYVRLDGTNTKDDKNEDGTKKPGLDYSNSIMNNMLTLRIQAKF